MSGGSYNYAYQHVEQFAEMLNAGKDCNGRPRGSTRARKKFAAHLLLVAAAMKDIEYVDSGDCDPGDEDAAIAAVVPMSVRRNKNKA